MDQILLNLMQMPGERTVSSGKKNSDAESFQKLMESQGGETEKPAGGQQAEGVESPGKPEAEQPQEPADGTVQATEDGLEIEKQMALAAMAMLQNPVVPVEQVMAPDVEPVVEAVGTADMAAAVETAEVLPELAEAAEAVAEAPVELGTEELEAMDAVETPEAAELPDAPKEDDAPQAVEASVEPIKAPEAAEESAEPKELEVDVRNGEESQPETEEKVEVQEGAAERPVFETVHEIPVKVGEAPAAKETAEPVEVQVENQLTEAISKGETKVEIQLNPENLGKIRVEMTLREDGGLLVQLHAENSRTQGILEKNLSGLEALLSRNTQQEVEVEVPRHQESQQQHLFDQQQQEKQQRQQQQRREQPHNSEDFLQQLRLGLIPSDEEL